MTERLLIREGRVVDPTQGLDDFRDILIEDGVIREVAPRLPTFPEAKTLEARGLIVAPGFIDMHVHLREPGEEDKETIETGTRAAAAGGFTAVACMANTTPVNDTAAVTQWILERARTVGIVRVYPVAAVTRGLRGEELTEMGELVDAGAVAFSDDGRPIRSTQVLRCALEYSRMTDRVLIDHCEDPDLTQGGAMNEGYYSSLLGLPGIPAEAEAIAVARDIFLARLTEAPVHVAHVSTRAAVELIRWAKQKGLPVTAEATPHHFTLSDRAVYERPYDTNLKMNPPLRTDDDVTAVVEGLADGTIDAIASDHAPHRLDDKRVEFDLAAFGVIGLETAVALALDRLVHTGRLSLRRMVELFTVGPARILRLPTPTVAPGRPADLTLIDPDQAWTYRVAESFSRSRNSPFDGWTFRGRAVRTIVGGQVVFEVSSQPAG
ncbi:MAG: dihydroorotase [Acidobacteria bacterium]|nr:dihydroorotase [Acidobacteriota bacterium]MDW7983900.1 dihydroorotase [Acidobacteriota bacterium]